MAVKKRLGEMLVDAGIIDETQLNAALGHQRRWGGRIGQVLVDMKLASETAIVDALALKFGFDVARFDQLEPYAFEQAKALVPRDYAVRNHVFPLAADTSVLVVAMSDPTNLSLADELSFKSGKRVKICIAGENAIAAAVRAHYDEEVVAAREAIILEADDGTAMEALYDPVGATSSEQLQRFFEQSPTAQPPPPAAGAPAAPPVKGAPPKARTRSPAALQLEDQRTE
jgi:type IV pilus assembly protein PilB